MIPPHPTYLSLMPSLERDSQLEVIKWRKQIWELDCPDKNICFKMNWGREQDTSGWLVCLLKKKKNSEKRVRFWPCTGCVGCHKKIIIMRSLPARKGIGWEMEQIRLKLAEGVKRTWPPKRTMFFLTLGVYLEGTTQPTTTQASYIVQRTSVRSSLPLGIAAENALPHTSHPYSCRVLTHQLTTQSAETFHFPKRYSC